MVLVQKWPFFKLFLLLNIGLENIGYDFLERKNNFLGYKKKKVQKDKMDIFTKGLTHGFCPKMAIFPTLFFSGNIVQENILYDILKRKNFFLEYKNKMLKKWKN